MRSVTNFNQGWLFEDSAQVDLPHTAVELPYNYFDETAYQRPFTYEKTFDADPAWDGNEVSLVFDGVMADAKVALNGQDLGAHRDGYTPFEVRLTDKLTPGQNTLSVTIDGNENPAIPPFGGMIDYLTYAGIYRDVWLKVTAPVSIANCKIETPDALSEKKSVLVTVWLANPRALSVSGTLSARICDAEGSEIATRDADIMGDRVTVSLDGLDGITLWDLDSPALYTLILTLNTEHGNDATRTRFGFRTATFTTEGFFLNGKPLKIRGLNRHQSFPYAGYAMGRAAQERDAEILKNELRLNLVRTSHYPQSTWFLDRCDELGLLVFEEIPGWQHIGDDAWKAESVRNVARMIERDWNHPSIILWGVRINESADDHDFYAETNRVAHELDPTRQTGGVRFITDSELLEDVYTMNDFFLGQEELGGNRPRTPLRPQQEVTGLDHVVPYMITEYNGHMYPTKSYDQEQRQAEHVLRHLQVLNAAYGDPQIAGCIGWCAFDYNTHKDFGSGDRICHHGVMDMFREPKFAAYAYASQGDPDGGAVLQPVTFWTRGDRNIGGILPLIVLTNCEEIALQFGDNPPKRIRPDHENFPHLPHPPVVIDHRHVTEADIGKWGWAWQGGTITGFIGGEKVAEARFSANPIATSIGVQTDSNEIGVHDDVRIIGRALDQAGNKLPFFSDPVSIKITGPAELIGPETVPFRGGSMGFWLRATGVGDVTASVTSSRLGTSKVQIAVRQGG